MTVCQTEQELTSPVSGWRNAGQRIVMTSDVFDLMHRGDVETLRQARGFGDRLILATGVDTSVRGKKASPRPSRGRRAPRHPGQSHLHKGMLDKSADEADHNPRMAS